MIRQSEAEWLSPSQNIVDPEDCRRERNDTSVTVTGSSVSILGILEF